MFPLLIRPSLTSGTDACNSVPAPFKFNARYGTGGRPLSYEMSLSFFYWLGICIKCNKHKMLLFVEFEKSTHRFTRRHSPSRNGCKTFIKGYCSCYEIVFATTLSPLSLCLSTTKMAAPKKVRIPTAEEMELSEREYSLVV